MWSQLFLHNIILQNNIWIFTPDISYQMCAATLSRCLSDTHFLCLRFCANSSGFECQVDKMRPPCKGHSVSPLHNNQNATKPLQSQPLALFITTTIMQTDCNCLLMSLLCTYPVSTSPDVAVRRIFLSCNGYENTTASRWSRKCCKRAGSEMVEKIGGLTDKWISKYTME